MRKVVVDTHIYLMADSRFVHLYRVQLGLVQKQFLYRQLFRNEAIRVTCHLLPLVLCAQTFLFDLAAQNGFVTYYPDDLINHIIGVRHE